MVSILLYGRIAPWKESSDTLRIPVMCLPVATYSHQLYPRIFHFPGSNIKIRDPLELCILMISEQPIDRHDSGVVRFTRTICTMRCKPRREIIFSTQQTNYLTRTYAYCVLTGYTYFHQQPLQNIDRLISVAIFVFGQKFPNFVQGIRSCWQNHVFWWVHDIDNARLSLYVILSFRIWCSPERCSYIIKKTKGCSIVLVDRMDHCPSNKNSTHYWYDFNSKVLYDYDAVLYKEMRDVQHTIL